MSEKGLGSSITTEELHYETVVAQQLATELRELQAEAVICKQDRCSQCQSKADALNLARAELQKTLEAEQLAQDRYVQIRDERNRLSASLRRQESETMRLRKT